MYPVVVCVFTILIKSSQILYKHVKNILIMKINQKKDRFSKIINEIENIRKKNNTN